MYTRQHFNKTAEIVGRISDGRIRNSQAHAWADAFAEGNPRFNWTLFMTAVEGQHRRFMQETQELRLEPSD
jgi:hypothetical protein